MVKNTGGFAGKEVVQLFVSVPAGTLDQPYQTLAAFKKTGELESGGQQTVKLQFDLTELASFDTDNACSVLEAGDYLLRLGNSSRDTQPLGIIRLEQRVVVSQLHRAGGTPDFEDWKPATPVVEEITGLPIVLVGADAFTTQAEAPEEGIDPELQKRLEVLSDRELTYLCTGNFNDKTDRGSVIGNAGNTVAGAAGETCGRLAGIPFLVMADGPAGLRLSPQYGVDEQGVFSDASAIDPILMELIDEKVLAVLGIDPNAPARKGEIHDQYCSAVPIATALAQSWNPALAEACGNLIGEEMERFGVHLWLAPALNIHRSVLCGRNFEYYSEDPLLSGKMAAAIARGVQNHPGRGATIKHFACNNQETNRFRSNSMVSQRALRDIYLRGFKIAIQEAQPHALMTSYNLLNGEHTAHRKDLNVDILREEWGFRGLVMTDWFTTGRSFGLPSKHPYACASGCIWGGNDVMMPGNAADHDDVSAALNNPNHFYPLTREALKDRAVRVVRLALRLTREAGQKA
jgi:beta-glucosidase